MKYKKLHSTDSVNYLQTITYGYNERGWLFTSYAPLFAETFDYNTNTNKQYNGNIAYQYWGVPGNLNNHFTYIYDKLNRLTSGITSLDNYQESGITYDVMGNISTLNRYQAGTEIDQLSYTYTSGGNATNQLQSVVDANASNTGIVSGTTNYTYDGNGNLKRSSNTADTIQNKGFAYNLLNLPQAASFLNGTSTYSYDATGNKLRKVDVISGITTATDYISGIQYGTTGGTTSLSFIQTEEGKAVVNGTGYDYTYYLGDNLGNTRITFDTKTGVADTLQRDDYYPFGLEINRNVTSPKNEYLYNKKELQEEFTEYDYGARFYDPVIGRFNTIDPKAELSRRFSTYTYTDDNPIRFVDPDGMSTEDPPNKPKPTLLTVDKKALEPFTSTTTTPSQKTAMPDNILTTYSGVDNPVNSVSETNTTVSTGTSTDFKTGKTSMTSSTISTTTTVSLGVTKDGQISGITGINQSTSITTMTTPIVSETKTSATLDVSATKTVNWGTTTQALPVNSKLSPSLQSSVQGAIFDNKAGIFDNIKTILDNTNPDNKN